MDLIREIIEEIKKRGIGNQISLNKLKLEFARKYDLKRIPSNVEITNHATPEEKKVLNKILTMKPGRVISGVTPVAVMTPPHSCPHGKCLCCPGGLDSYYGNVPQSYTGKEPAARRAIRNKYDPYLQVMNRLEQYVAMNKMPGKVEIIIMGGTFPSIPLRQQNNFVKYIFKALNDFSQKFYSGNSLNSKRFNEFFEMYNRLEDEERIERIHKKLRGLKKQNIKELEYQQRRNETSHLKCVSLVIETRPDHCSEKEINQLLKLGCTKVELGVQSTYDKPLEIIKRGHSVQDTIDSTRRLKDAGFKINYHMMPGLPGISYKEDLEGLKKLFTNPDFKPDMLKIYPCMVMKGTGLYDMYKNNKFKPLTTHQAAELITEFKKHVPKYVRIMRVQRDIPTFTTEEGVDRTNLRQYVDQLREKKGIECNCIRCREIGRKNVNGRLVYKKIKYNASKGIEYFITAEIKDSLVGFCRLRFPHNTSRKEINSKSSLIRELHVYGAAASIGEKGEFQHKGVGKELLKMAEDISRKNNYTKIVVISGVGVRGYYRKQGYRKQGPYMVKSVVTCG